jgi:putative nucleotidyltransferase with HDIG domain
MARRAELIGALSLATDLGLGTPLEFGLRTCRVAVALADELGLDAATRRSVYYASLLAYVGCTADSGLAARYLGDEHAFGERATLVARGAPGEMTRLIVRTVGPRITALPRLKSTYEVATRSHCEVARLVIERLGLGSEVAQAAEHVFERWDGKGLPYGKRGEDIPLAARVLVVADDAVRLEHTLGREDAVARVRSRAGGAFDPAVVAAFGPGLMAPIDTESLWEEVVALEPGGRIELADDALDEGLRAMGEFADLKSLYTVGHSDDVATLAAAAAEHLRLDARAVRRAALVHDVGRVAVSVLVWDKPGPLNADERERVRLHPYHGERVLARAGSLSSLATLAAAHHERLDGSGYHRGLSAPGLSGEARVLAAADAFQAMTQARPYREAHAPEQAAELLAAEARAGRLDPEAVAAVVEAAGQPVPRLERPCGLTAREAEVLRLLARGLASKQIARALEISPRTANHHIEHVYAKLGVSTRAAAALLAMQHGLVTWGELPMAGLPFPP